MGQVSTQPTRNRTDPLKRSGGQARVGGRVANHVKRQLTIRPKSATINRFRVQASNRSTAALGPAAGRPSDSNLSTAMERDMRWLMAITVMLATILTSGCNKPATETAQETSAVVKEEPTEQPRETAPAPKPKRKSGG